MTQIFTGNGLGLHGSSVNQLGDYGPKSTGSLGQGGISMAVNVANGNLVLQQFDGFLASIGTGFDLIHSYNSQAVSGSSWRFNSDTRLLFDSTNATLRRRDEDGHVSTLTYDPTHHAYLSEDRRVSIRYQSSEWIYREADTQRVWHYDLNGQLTRLSDNDGHDLIFTYQNGVLQRVSSQQNKQQVIWSFNQGLLQEVTYTSDNSLVHHLRYTYDDQHRLNCVTRDLGDGKSYWIAYDYVGDSNRIGAIRQSDGTNIQLEYDSQNRITRLIDGEGRWTSYTYQSGQTVITNGLGETWCYIYDSESRLIGIDGPEQYRIRYQYDDQYLTAVTQGNQHWYLSYNDSGDCVRLESPNGNVLLRDYDEAHHVISETHYQAFDGDHHPIKPQTTYNLYDAQGHLRFEITATGVVTECRYDAEGLCTSRRCYLQNRFTSASPTLEALTLWANSQPIQSINLVEYQYDWRGNPSEERHYTLVDANGDGILTVDTLRLYSRYDAAGRLIEASKPTTSGLNTTHYVYDDLGRLMQTIDNLGRTQSITYDDHHHQIYTTDRNGLTTVSVYDSSGLVLSTHRLDLKQDYGTTTYRYDATGRLIAETDVSGQTTYLFYDQQGRLQAKISKTGQVITYEYDEQGHCLRTTTCQHTVDTQSWQGIAPAWSAIAITPSVNDRVSQTIYNQYQQAVYTIDAEGAVIAYDYDALGRVITKTAYAHRLPSYNPGHLYTVDELRLIPDDNDRVWSTYYDPDGHVLAEVNGEGSVTAYTYDAMGHVITNCHYAQKVQGKRSGDWLLDAPTASRSDITTYCLYNTAGLNIATIDSEQYLTEYRYDANGLMTETIAYATAVDNLNTLSLEVMRPNAHPNDHHTRYQYNDLNQRVQEYLATGLVIDYRYDEQGLLISKTSTDSKTHIARQQAYRYDGLGRVIQQLDEIGAAQLQTAEDLSPEAIESLWQQHSVRFTYDNAGRVLSRSNALNQTWHYVYNDAGLLRYTVSAAGSVTEMRYNAFQQITTTIHYQAQLKELRLSCDALKQWVSTTANDQVDEITHYDYDRLGLLTRQRRGQHQALHNAYNAFGELEQRIEDVTSRISSYLYDHRGLLHQQINDVGKINQTLTMEYDVFGRNIKQQDGKRGETTSVFNRRGEAILVEKPNHHALLTRYDAFGRVIFLSDKTELHYLYDDANCTLSITHGDNLYQVKTTFNAFGDTITVTDANHNITSYHYDVKGQLIHVDGPEDSAKDFTYDAAGQLLLQQTTDGQCVQLTYDADGRTLTKTIDPEGLALSTSFTYDGIGRQLQVIDGELCTRYDYNDQGQVTSMRRDPDGLNLTTVWLYDDDGQVVRETQLNPSGSNHVTAYTWDALGRCLSKTHDPDGLSITTYYTYDQNNNLVSQTDPNHHLTYSVYDLNNQLRYRIDARGVVTEQRYDRNGNTTETITYAKPVPLRDDYTETELGMAIEASPQEDHHHFFLYDGQNRLELSYDGLGFATRYCYDLNDNLIQSIAYDVPCSLEKLQQRQWPIPSAGTQTRTTRMAYDGLNRQRFRIDSNRAVSENHYNAAGLLIAQTRYVNRLNTLSDYSLLSIQAALVHDAANDETTRYAYDKAGRLTQQASAAGHVTAYRYDGLNHVIETRRYACALTNTQLATDHWSTLMNQQADDRITTTWFDAVGRERYRISSMGHVIERRYDAVGNVLQEVVHAQALDPSCDSLTAIENALSTDPTNDHTNDYHYDALGRLLQHTDAAGHVVAYAYDANDNLLQKTEANMAVWTYRYDAVNQRIATLAPVTTFSSYRQGKLVDETRAVLTAYHYDNFGNLIMTIRDVGGLNQTVQYTYDVNNHPLSTIYPDVLVDNSGPTASKTRQERCQTLTESKRYNAFGEVIETIDCSGNRQQLVYDSMGQLRFSLSAEGRLTEYQTNALGETTQTIRYANTLPLTFSANDNETNVLRALVKSKHDRHEFSRFDTEHHLIETRLDEVLGYDANHMQYLQLAPVTTRQYNAFGEIVSQAVQLTESDWAVTRFYFNNDGLKVASLDPEGYLTTYHFNAFGLIDSETQFAQRCPSFSDNLFTEPAASIDDRTTRFEYDALGQLTRKTLKNIRYQQLTGSGTHFQSITGNLSSEYRYDALGHLVSTTDPRGAKAYSYYNDAGLLTASIGASTSAGRAATTYRYDALGQLLESHCWALGASQADEHDYTLAGASNDDVILTDVYNNGHLVQQTDGTGQSVYYSYNANGTVARQWRLIHHTDNTFQCRDTRYRYDNDRNLLQTAEFKGDGSLRTEDNQYNAFAEVTGKGLNGDYTTRIDYDLCGRVWRSNTQGYYQIYLYDLAAHLTQVVTATNADVAETDERGVDLADDVFAERIGYRLDVWRYKLQRQDNRYDARGYLVGSSNDGRISHFDVHQPIETTRIEQFDTVDRWGNTIAHTSANGYTTTYEYNAFNAVTRQILPQVTVVDEHGIAKTLHPIIEYAYDALGQAIAMTDANNHTVAKILDAENRVIQEIDAAGYHRNKTYNALGQLTTLTNERGALTTYTYDKANRLASITTHQTQVKYAYNGAGELIEQTDAIGNTTSYSYDTLGHQLTQQHDWNKQLTTTTYDDAGHKTTERDANGYMQSWTYDNEGHLLTHTDLSGRVTTYLYSRNGLLLKEQSTNGKDIRYHYFNDGELLQYDDRGRGEVVNFTYDAEGNVTNKQSSRLGNWIVEDDQYQYDTLGRLTQVNRRQPDGSIVLGIGYAYDAAGNIRQTSVSANYNGYQQISHMDYFTYDANDRLLINKGQLNQGVIAITSAQGSQLSYDESGNIKTAAKYEDGALQQYTYRYNLDNQLEQIEKNGFNLQTKRYSAGLVTEEKCYDAYGKTAQLSLMSYDHGQLVGQTTKNHSGRDVNKTAYTYDAVGNLTRLTAIITPDNGHSGYTQQHDYDYERWDSYLQKTDTVQVTGIKYASSYGQSLHVYDVNGLLQDVIDSQTDANNHNNSMHYFVSSLDGIRARMNKDGQTHYLTVAGKTIGDLRLDDDKTQHLDVYGGFTPVGSLQKAGPGNRLGAKHQPTLTSTAAFLQKEANKQRADGTLPEAPQDALGVYTLQAGDTLESVALQVYGDSSLWHLLADANGVTERNARTGEMNSPLHIGQRLTIPQAANGQRHSMLTHKPINTLELKGEVSPTVQMPAVASPKPHHHHNFWHTLANITIVVVAAAATILTAGVFASIATGASLMATGLLASGLSVLGGAATGLTIAQTVGIGFAAGFVGHLAGQGIANLLNIQKGIDLQHALIAGLATAATAGFGRALSTSSLQKSLLNTLNDYSNSTFSLTNATEMLERDALGQGINLALNNQHHFNWQQLAVSSATAGIANSSTAQTINQHLKQTAPFINTELQALATSTLSGQHQNAATILQANLGNAINATLLQALTTQDPKDPPYCPIPNQESYTPIPTHLPQLNAQQWNHNDEATFNYGVSLFGNQEQPLAESLVNGLHEIDNKNKVILGNLSMQYETGRRPGEHILASGTVSSGKNDDGGISYGAYQLSSSKNQVQSFLQNEGQPWSNQFNGLDATKKGKFGDVWKSIANSDGNAFYNAQYDYIYRTHYAPVVNYIQRKTGLNVDNQPIAVQNVIWSSAVQHANAKYFLVEAINSLKKMDINSNKYASILIDTIYDKRGQYVSKLNIPNKWSLLHIRYPDERQRALQMLEKY